MVKYNFEGLEDKDIFACYTLAGTADGKVNEIEFVRLLDQRREQVKQEVVMLSQELEKLEISKGISKQDFEKQGRIYLTAMERGTNMREAAEYLELLKQERNAKPRTDMEKISAELKTSSYDSPKDVVKTEEGQREKPQKEGVETVEKVYSSEWENDGNIKLESLKKKFERR